MRTLRLLAALLPLLAGTAAAQLPANPALAAFTALPVRYPALRNPSIGPFQAAHVARNFGSTGSELAGYGVLAAYGSRAVNKLRFTVEDGRQQQQAQVYALADLQLRGNALRNLSGVLFPGRDSAQWRSQNIDTFAGVITLAGQPAGSFWQFAVDNPSQIGSRPLRGEVHNAQYTIRFEEVRNAAAYADAGGMATAALAAEVQHGYLFLYDGQAVAALDMPALAGTGPARLLTAPPVLWLKNQLDPNIQLVLTSTALALLARPVMK